MYIAHKHVGASVLNKINLGKTEWTEGKAFDQFHTNTWTPFPPV